jgi:hypothetical protein
MERIGDVCSIFWVQWEGGGGGGGGGDMERVRSRRARVRKKRDEASRRCSKEGGKFPSKRNSMRDGGRERIWSALVTA